MKVLKKYVFTDNFRNVAGTTFSKEIAIKGKQQEEVKYFSFKNLKLHNVDEDLVLTLRFDQELLTINPQRVTGDLIEVVAISALDNS
jgi:hypothetical protein